MKKLLAVLLVFLFAQSSANAATLHWLSPGTKQATPYYAIDSHIPGPTVVVTGGMHGNEEAGYKATWEFTGYWVKKGKLVVIPEINRPAVQAGKRESTLGDLNRDFPHKGDKTPDNYHAQNVWNLMLQLKPDVLIDLHEGWGVHKNTPSSVGQSVIYYPAKGPWAKGNAAAMQQAMSSLAMSSHLFSLMKYPISGSLARAIGNVFGTQGIIVETYNKQVLSLRVAQHRMAVQTMLSRLGMI